MIMQHINTALMKKKALISIACSKLVMNTLRYESTKCSKYSSLNYFETFIVNLTYDVGKVLFKNVKFNMSVFDGKTLKEFGLSSIDITNISYSKAVLFSEEGLSYYSSVPFLPVNIMEYDVSEEFISNFASIKLDADIFPLITEYTHSLESAVSKRVDSSLPLTISDNNYFTQCKKIAGDLMHNTSLPVSDYTDHEKFFLGLIKDVPVISKSHKRII